MNSKLIILTSLLALSNVRPSENSEKSDVGRTLVSTLLEGRIMGGHDAEPGQFPHQVTLQVGIPNKVPYTHFCGGTILDERWILTAGHCIDAVEDLQSMIKNVSFVVKAGKQDLSKSEDTEQVSEVIGFKKHEMWRGDGQPGPYDVALLQIETPLRFNKRVKKINLPVKDSEPQGETTLSGWGAISNSTEHPKMPTILQTINTPIVPRKECNEAVEKVAAEEGEVIIDAVDETNICTGPLDGGISACGGDSGGPLIMSGENGELEVVGIVSWGLVPCGRLGAPSVFVKVSHFTDWILDAMKN